MIALLLPTIAFATTKYVVTKGDNLYDLSRKFGVSVKDIKTVNKLSNNNLGIGNELLIPESNLKRNNRYVVKSGDTISQIAEKFGVKTKDLKDSNRLKNDKLKIGQILYIPYHNNSTNKVVVSKDEIVGPSIDEKRITSSENIQQKTPDIYTVKNGDTLGHIAEKHNVSVANLRKANGLKNDKLKIGQVLTIANRHKNTVPLVRKIPAQTITINYEYIVKKGDTLSEIADKHGIRTNDLKKVNKLKNHNLQIGQKLFLTPNKEIKTASNKSDKKSKPNYSGDYTVKKGDTLGHVAIKFGISVKDLKNANDLTNNNLSIGKVLKVPGSTNKNKATAKKSNTKPKKITRHSMTKYIVKKGDTLGGISSRHGVSVAKIKEASSLKNNKINVGDVLLIPGTQEKSTSSKYIVVTGDTLGKIGNKFGVSIKELKDTNNLTKNDLYVGMKLVVPSNSKITSSNTRAAKKPAQKKSAKYVVKRGDTLGLIAKRYGVSVGSLKTANNMRGNGIKAGQKITIPGSAEYRIQKKKTAYSSNNYNTKEGIIRMAKQYLGAPYKFGGYSFKTGIDCSGYVKKIFSKFNVELPRTARDIYYNAGIRVVKSQLQTGDLVFFRTYASYPSHVGIYMGNNLFIHASSGARKVAITSLDKKYYRNRYIGAKRIRLSTIFENEIARK
ncbi:MAG: LysM peptidoglycan-binding domain-containing protein [Candidatus Dadabacteria bacterium]|nr:LysM peptidoglycan-binding domain-containing protein [Candidatus Dadabacteria bacterium]